MYFIHVGSTLQSFTTRLPSYTVLYTPCMHTHTLHLSSIELEEAHLLVPVTHCQYVILVLSGGERIDTEITWEYTHVYQTRLEEQQF